MTVNYNKEISTSHPWSFFLLLFRWKGSIWKHVYPELLSFFFIYGAISSLYRYAMDEPTQRTFESIVRYFDRRLSYIPLELVLGFFCTLVINRWTKLYQTIGFIDNIGLMAACYVRGKTEEARIIRRNMIRYSELIQVLVFRDISMRTRKRFPTLDTVVAAGFMTDEELKLYDSYSTQTNLVTKYWIPANWAIAMTTKAWKKGYIESEYYKTVMEQEIRTWRTQIEWVCNYDWVPLPLMYPQVVCLAVHLYFLIAIIARQYIILPHEQNDEIDTYFPIMTVIQFMFYMGWLKVIEAMLNPFGEDDDDFETNALIDRNITVWVLIFWHLMINVRQMGLKIVDDGFDKTPDVRRDIFYDDFEVQPLYSEESSHTPTHPYIPSASSMKISESKVTMIPHSESSTHLYKNAPNARRSQSVAGFDELGYRKISLVPSEGTTRASSPTQTTNTKFGWPTDFSFSM